MSFKQRHGLLGLGLLGVGFVIAVLSQSPVGHQQAMAGGGAWAVPTGGSQATGNNVVPDSLQGDWEKVPYPVLDRLISQRAAAARAAAGNQAQASLANR